MKEPWKLEDNVRGGADDAIGINTMRSLNTEQGTVHSPKLNDTTHGELQRELILQVHRIIMVPRYRYLQSRDGDRHNDPGVEGP